MDWKLAIKEEREVLKRIVALFYALANLTDRAAGRSHPMRGFVLWILRPAMAIALDYIADAGPVHEALLRENGDSIAESRRYSRCFRAAARSIKGLFRALDRCEAQEDGGSTLFGHPPVFGALFGRGFAAVDLLARLRNLAQDSAGLSRDGLAPALSLPERRDSS